MGIDLSPIMMVVLPIMIIVSIFVTREKFEFITKVIIASFCLFYFVLFGVSIYLAWIGYAIVISLSLVFIIKYVLHVFESIKGTVEDV